jgi:DNA-binding response OmpR family regulator
VADRVRSQGWDAPVPVIRVGDLVLIRAEGSARLARVWSDANAATAGEPSDEQKLPAKEAGLLAFLMRHHHQIVSKSRLIEAVWGMGGAGPDVVDVHMARLRRILQRLDPSGTRARIETRRGMGYSLHIDNSGE